jgi:hypothetical protein
MALSIRRLLVAVVSAPGLLVAAWPAPAQAAASPVRLAFYESGDNNLSRLAPQLNRITDLAPTGVFLAADTTLQLDSDQRTTVALA